MVFRFSIKLILHQNFHNSHKNVVLEIIINNKIENKIYRRYGHSAVLVEMHPPKIMIYGGLIDSKTFEFDVPDSLATDENEKSEQTNDAIDSNAFPTARYKSRKGKKYSSLFVMVFALC